MRLFVFAIDARRKSPSFCPKKSPLHSGHKWQWVGIPKIFDKYQLCDASRILAHLAIGFEHYLWNCICKQLVELDFSPVIKRILRYLILSTVRCCRRRRRCRVGWTRFCRRRRFFDLRRFCNFSQCRRRLLLNSVHGSVNRTRCCSPSLILSRSFVWCVCLHCCCFCCCSSSSILFLVVALKLREVFVQFVARSKWGDRCKYCTLICTLLNSYFVFFVRHSVSEVYE